MPIHFPPASDFLSFITESKKPVTKKDIAKAFKIKGSGRVALKQVLKKLMADGSIQKDYKKAYSPQDGLPQVTVVKFIGINKDKDWIAEPEKPLNKDKQPHITIKPKGNIDPIGNTALVRLEKLSDKKYIGTIIKIFKKETMDQTLAGSIIGSINILSDGSGILTPSERGKVTPIQISKNNLNNAKSGDIAVVSGNQSKAKVLKILGKANDPKVLSLISILQQEIPYIFPETVLKETETMSIPTDLDEREDLTNTPLITIDGADARDFDDAVFAEPDTNPKNKGGWHLIVAIADVSYYVSAGTALNDEAYLRGNSTYFADRVVPMLPEKLSNNLCSLRPNEPRACLSVHLWITDNGELKKYKFTRSLIKSHARLTYEEVQQAQNGNPCNKTKDIFVPIIKPLYEAYAILKKARNERGALDIDLPEYQVNLNKAGHIDSISTRSRLDSHQLIEEFMVLANIAAAKALEEKQTKTVYRIHPAPDAAKLAAAHSFFKSIGQNFGNKVGSTPKDLNNILHKVKNLDIAPLANIVILRSQNKAIYHTENQGHFGLSLTHYTHFTSPIRRYADLLVHRALVKTFNLGKGGQTKNEAVIMDEMAEHISTTERRSMVAERTTMDKFMALYLSEHIGAEFEATINGVNKAGLFITVKDCGSDGFIPARLLPKDYYIHDEARHCLVGQRTKQEFQLCAPIVVKLKEAEPLTGSTIFILTQYKGKPVEVSPDRKKRRFSQKKKFKNKKRHKK